MIEYLKKYVLPVKEVDTRGDVLMVSNMVFNAMFMWQTREHYSPFSEVSGIIHSNQLVTLRGIYPQMLFMDFITKMRLLVDASIASN